MENSTGALTAMINYYRNIFPGLLNQTEWNVLQVPTLMIWGENDRALGKELTYDLTFHGISESPSK